MLEDRVGFEPTDPLFTRVTGIQHRGDKPDSATYPFVKLHLFSFNGS
jgi:hypothetical protein